MRLEFEYGYRKWDKYWWFQLGIGSHNIVLYHPKPKHIRRKIMVYIN